MLTAILTTVVSFLPVFAMVGAEGKLFKPLAIPSFGGMCIELMTLFFVPVTYCLIQEIRLKLATRFTSPQDPLSPQDKE